MRKWEMVLLIFRIRCEIRVVLSWNWSRAGYWLKLFSFTVSHTFVEFLVAFFNFLITFEQFWRIWKIFGFFLTFSKFPLILSIFFFYHLFFFSLFHPESWHNIKKLCKIRFWVHQKLGFFRPPLPLWHKISK